jgi:hypothetical protein
MGTQPLGSTSLVFGTVFVMFRDLWPLVFAHAVIDFVVILRSGSFAP